MLPNNNGDVYSFIKEQMQIKGANTQASNKNDRLAAVEKRLLEMVDSLKITKYKPQDEDIL